VTAGAHRRKRATFYRTAMRVSATNQLQYRATNYFLLVAMVLEAVIYLALWQAVVAANGGELRGWGASDVAAYFVVWTLVRNMGLAFTPYGFEDRIQSGVFSTNLLRPMHPIHHDIAQFAGWKAVMLLLWLPVAVALFLLFRPAFAVDAAEVVTFVVACCAAFLIRSLYLWWVGMVSFWTTRATGLFDMFLAVELLLSGRLIPMRFLPDWATGIADVLPFKWVLGFPIDTLVGELSAGQLLRGLGMQFGWLAVCAGLVALTWRFAIRRYTAVGN
jgi:viologen exporter family transport system permease protein